MKLTGRTILITGGSAGIGLAFALKFLELGNTVIVTGRRQAVLDEVKAKYPKLHTIQSDVADPAQIAALAARVKAEFPKLDVLMNNAGIMLHKNLKVPAADLDGLMAEMNINLGGVIRTTSAFIDILTTNKGTVINVSSALAFVPLPSAPIYCATKAAVHSYTQSLRFQLEETGVEVIELMPPAVKTDLTAELHEGDGVTLITTDELMKHPLQTSRRVSSRSGRDSRTARIDAPPGPRFHQPAALEGVEEAGAGWSGIDHEVFIIDPLQSLLLGKRKRRKRGVGERSRNRISTDYLTIDGSCV